MNSDITEFLTSTVSDPEFFDRIYSQRKCAYAKYDNVGIICFDEKFIVPDKISTLHVEEHACVSLLVATRTHYT